MIDLDRLMTPLSEYYRFAGAHMDIVIDKMLLNVKWSNSAVFDGKLKKRQNVDHFFEIDIFYKDCSFFHF